MKPTHSPPMLNQPCAASWRSFQRIHVSASFAITSAGCCCFLIYFRIIDPLTSRCAKFRFKPISQNEAIQRLEYISTVEGVTVENPKVVLGHLITQSKGDMRRAITLLQGLYLMNQPITPDSIDQVVGNIPKEITHKLLSTCKDRSHSINTIYDILSDQIIRSGFSASNVLTRLVDALISDPDFSEKSKAKLSLSIADSEFALTSGADETIQLLNVLIAIRSELVF